MKRYIVSLLCTIGSLLIVSACDKVTCKIDNASSPSSPYDCCVPPPYEQREYAYDFFDVAKGMPNGVVEIVSKMSDNKYFICGAKMLNAEKSDYALYCKVALNYDDTWLDDEYVYYIDYYVNNERKDYYHVIKDNGVLSVFKCDILNTNEVVNQFRSFVHHHYLMEEAEYEHYDWFNDSEEIELLGRECTKYSFYDKGSTANIDIYIDKVYDLAISERIVYSSRFQSRYCYELNDTAIAKYYIDAKSLI